MWILSSQFLYMLNEGASPWPRGYFSLRGLLVKVTLEGSNRFESFFV